MPDRRSCLRPQTGALAAARCPRSPRSSSATRRPVRILSVRKVAGPRSRARVPRFGLLPQRFHLVDTGFRQGSPALGQLPLDIAEALPELGVGLAQRLLRIDFDEPRQVHEYEEKIAHLVLDLFTRSRFARRVELCQLFPELVEHLGGV